MLLVTRTPVMLFESGVNAVPGGGVAGWVSGDIASLAASATVNVVFDLGPEWRQYSYLELTVIPVAPSSGLNPVQFFASDSVAPNSARRRGSPFATGGTTYFVNLATGPGTQTMAMRPAGRYLICKATNADAANAQGATARVTLAAFPS